VECGVRSGLFVFQEFWRAPPGQNSWKRTRRRALPDDPGESSRPDRRNAPVEPIEALNMADQKS
jgi:hypothetical protein